MNAEPHTHTLSVRFDLDGDAHLAYGDQRCLVWHRFTVLIFIPLQWRINFMARRLIRRHDRASRRAGLRHNQTEAMAGRLHSAWAEQDIEVEVRR